MEECQPFESFSLEACIYAMAPAPCVVQVALSGGDDMKAATKQDRFAAAVQRAWHDPYSPSKSYLSHLVKLFVERVGDENLESEVLMEVLLQVLSFSSSQNDPGSSTTTTELDTSCYLSFWMPLDSEEKTAEQKSTCTGDHPLRVKVYPKHNDVALRLWEAGAFLAEYLVAHPSRLSGQYVVELGSGTGATALALAACSKIQGMYCTDLTPICLENLQHNIDMNQAWLAQCRTQKVLAEGHDLTAPLDHTSRILEAGCLDWTWFDEDDDNKTSETEQHQCAQRLLSKSDVLLAADVAYDRSVLTSLVNTIYFFLSSCDNRKETRGKKPKQAILATTRRNLETYRMLEQALADRHIRSKREEITSLPPILFPCHFHQPRTDVWVTTLTLA